MAIEIKFLENVTLEEIHDTFSMAFADYQANVSYMTLEVMKKRFIKNGFTPELSTGVFENNKLKGFTITGTGMYQNKTSAFDIMTGIEKEYRGRGLANQMFHLIRQKMKNLSIKNCYLEVLQENKQAIDAYTKTGFQKTRELDCYSLKIARFTPVKPIQTVVYIDKGTKKEIDNCCSFLDWEPSWENHFESVKRIEDDLNIIIARHSGKKVGILIYYPTLAWIMIVAVDPKYRRMGVATSLLEYLLDIIPIYQREIKIMNVQNDDLAIKTFLKNSGFELITSQHEMEFHMR